MATKVPKPFKERIARTVSDLLVLPLQLPPLPSFSTPATHYLYIRPDAPKQPTSDTPRSLFMSNIPVDATEGSIRELFKSLQAGIVVDRVDFESDIKDEDVLGALGLETGVATVRGTEVQTGGVNVLGKRKRQEERELREVEQDMRMPRTWESDLRTSGSSAVAVFVDASSKQMAWKACRAAVKEERKIEWKGGESTGNR